MPSDAPPNPAPTADLACSASHFEALLERAFDGIFVRRGGELLYVNPALLALLGYDDPNELVGRPVLTFIHPDHHALLNTAPVASHTAHRDRRLRPLATVGRTDALAQKRDAVGSAREVLAAGQRAADLTRQLLALSRRQVLEPRIVDVNLVVERMASMLSRLVTADELLGKVREVLDADLGSDLDAGLDTEPARSEPGMKSASEETT